MALKEAWRWLTASPQPPPAGAGLARRAFSWPYSTDLTQAAFFSLASIGGDTDRERPAFGFTQLVDQAFRSNAVVFSCEQKRVSVFSEARFLYRTFNKGRPGKLWSDPSLSILEKPWPRGTTSDLLAEVQIMADFGGNAFVVRDREPVDRLRVMRPDYVTIVMGDSSGRPVESPAQLDAEVLGFIYDPQDGRTAPEALLADEVAHYIPPGLRDPLSRFRGMSWVTPIIREMLADQATTMHKLAFFENGATPQLVVSFDSAVTEEQFQAFVQKMDSAHQGWRNAYKTLYLGGGADVTPVGKDLQQLEFSSTQGKGETRIAAASGIHPVLIPLSEGMQGSSLNAGNYAAARRSTADTTFRPMWRNICGSLATIVPPPDGSEIWYDEVSIPFLREDSDDAAEIMSTNAATIVALVNGGFTWESAVDAVDAQDATLLKHTGLVSVQLQPPLTTPPSALELPAPNGNGSGAMDAMPAA